MDRRDLPRIVSDNRVEFEYFNAVLFERHVEFWIGRETQEPTMQQEYS